MCIACKIPKTTNTHSEYGMLVALPLQQWLHELAWSYVYTYNVCLVRRMIFIYFTRDIRKLRNSTSLQSLQRRNSSRADFDRETFATMFSHLKLPPLIPVTPNFAKVMHFGLTHTHIRVCVRIATSLQLQNVANQLLVQWVSAELYSDSKKTLQSCNTVYNNCTAYTVLGNINNVNCTWKLWHCSHTIPESPRSTLHI
jgi:hypothetical protein